MNYLAYQNRDILFSLSIKSGQSQSDIFDVAFLSKEVVACASNESAEQQKNVTFQPNETTATQKQNTSKSIIPFKSLTPNSSPT